eukprot:COSAG06_NODE_383_length_16525_cov_86.720017_7_plen_137_part_00
MLCNITFNVLCNKHLPARSSMASDLRQGLAESGAATERNEEALREKLAAMQATATVRSIRSHFSFSSRFSQFEERSVAKTGSGQANSKGLMLRAEVVFPFRPQESLKAFEEKLASTVATLQSNATVRKRVFLRHLY